MPALSTYTQLGEGTGSPFITPGVQPPRNNIQMIKIPIRDQVGLVIYNEDNISFTPDMVSFVGSKKEILYAGIDNNINTYFTDQGVKNGFILQVAGTQENNGKYNVQAIRPGVPIGTETHLVSGDFSDITKWTATGDFSTSGAFVYTSNQTSNLSQDADDLPYTMPANTKFRLEYQMNITTQPDGDFELYLPEGLAVAKTPIPIVANGVIEFYTSNTPGIFDFVIEALSTTATEGTFSFTQLSLFTAGVSEALLVSQTLTDEISNSAVINQDPAAIIIVYDVRRDEFFKFSGLDVISSSSLTGGNQRENINLILDSTGKIVKYPDDFNAQPTTEDAYVVRSLELYYSNFNKFELDFKNIDNTKKAVLDIEVENDRFGTSSKNVTVEGKEVYPLKSYPLPGGFFGKLIKFRISDADVINNIVVFTKERRKRV